MRAIVLAVAALLLAAPAAAPATPGPAAPDVRSAARIVPERIAVAPGARLLSVLVRAERRGAPLVVVLAGGPGASSLSPLVLGTGPWTLRAPFARGAPRLTRNPHGWQRMANVVYLDQPRGTGWSADAALVLPSVAAAGRDFARWLAGFHRAHPRLADRPVILAGESFAGAWIADFAARVRRAGVRLGGVLLTAPSLGTAREQGALPADAELRSLCRLELLPARQCDPGVPGSLAATVERCAAAAGAATLGAVGASGAQSCRAVRAQTGLVPMRLRDGRPLDGLELPAGGLVRRHAGFSPNPYDVALPCRPSGGFPPWCSRNGKLERLFGDPGVRAWLGGGLVPAHVRWRFASFRVNTALGFPPAVPSLRAYARLLRAGVPITIAAGTRDLITSAEAIRALTDRIAIAAYGRPLPAGDDVRVGRLRLAVLEAGHLLAHDRPRAVASLLAPLVRAPR